MQRLDSKSDLPGHDIQSTESNSGQSNSNAEESTVDKLRAAMETSAVNAPAERQADSFQNEAACALAVRLACRIVFEPASDSLDDRRGIGGPSNRSMATMPVDEIGIYRLLKKLGQGGMGTVYQALHPRLDKIVAVKVLRANRLNHAEMVNRFQREMKVVGSLDHPHLVRAFDAGDADGIPYLVMEYLDGANLECLLKDWGPLPIPDACELVRQAAMGLQAAHARGMVHRDIKPANLMLARQEFGPPIVKVLDLGLALLAGMNVVENSSLTRHRQVMGTIEYMAPEQADNSHTVDQQADIYSLGATLYTLLTGGPIFTGLAHQTLMQQLSTLANQPVRSILECRDDVDEPLASIVHCMLARKPSDRFATMADVIIALNPFTAGANLDLLLTNVSESTTVVRHVAESLRDSEASRDDSAAVSNRHGQFPLSAGPGNTVNIPKHRPAAPGRGEYSPLRTHVQDTAPSRGTIQPRTLRTAITAATIALLAAVWFTLNTAHGTVSVDVDGLSPDELQHIEIKVSGNGELKIANQANGWSIGVKEGKYDVQLTGGSDRLKIDHEQVIVSRRDSAVVRVTIKPLPVATNTSKRANSYTWPPGTPAPAIAPFDTQQAKSHQATWAKHLKLPLEYTNSVGMQFILIPPGEFLMGSPNEEQASVMDAAIATTHERWPLNIKSEGPQHKVVLTKPIYLGIHEVTQKQFHTVMGKNPAWYVPTNPETARALKNVDTSQFPVESISYHEMTAFCLKVSQLEAIESPELTSVASDALMKDTNGYRLPTEAEWEFACRAGTTTRYWPGERDVDLLSSSWPNMSSDRYSPFPVGSTKANPFGLFDMLSNVTEYAQDEDDPTVSATYYSQFETEPAIDPRGRLAQPYRISKGGSFNSQPWMCRAAKRWISALPGQSEQAGFRVAISVEGVRQTLQQKPAAQSPVALDRQTAEWLRSFNPSMSFEVTFSDESIQRVAPEQPLPMGPFRLHYLHLYGPQIEAQGDAFIDELARHVKGLHITGISLVSPYLTSAGVFKLTQIPELSDLKALTLFSDRVDDDMFSALTSFPKLQSVNFRCPKITGKGVHRLGGLKSVTLLDCTNLAPAGIEDLQQLPHLNYLHIGGFHYTEQHLSALCKLQLNSFITDETGLDDAQIARLAGMTNLERLLVRDHPFSDPGLAALKPLKKLILLDITGTKVTAAGVADFQRALPNCKIEWERPKQ